MQCYVSYLIHRHESAFAAACRWDRKEAVTQGSDGKFGPKELAPIRSPDLKQDAQSLVSTSAHRFAKRSDSKSAISGAAVPGKESLLSKVPTASPLCAAVQSATYVAEPEKEASRNPAGWLPMEDSCQAGGVVSQHLLVVPKRVAVPKRVSTLVGCEPPSTTISSTLNPVGPADQTWDA